MESAASDLEGVDPLVNRLEPSEQAIVAKLLRLLNILFPGQDLGHQLKEPNDTYFGLYIAGFRVLRVESIRRLITPHRTLFRHYEVMPTTDGTNAIAMLLTFYRVKNKGAQPLTHECKTTGIKSQDFRKMLSDSSLSPKERDNVQQLIEQFGFVERYVSGNIMSSVQDHGDHYEIVFSNVKKLPSGFVSSYLHLFKELDLEIEITAVPFEVNVRIYRESKESDSEVSNKKRGRSDDGDNGKHKKRK
jgi:hypothetical protein